MTINRNDVITIPKWLIIVLLPMLVAGVTSYGLYKANNAQIQEQIKSSEKTLIRIDNSKVDRSEFTMLKEQLNRIETKMDVHLSKNK